MKEIEVKNLDSILANESELIPSSGFLASVMERVEEEAAAPPPIPFPWKRALPGMVLATGVLGWGGVEFARYALQAGGMVSLHKLSASLPASVPASIWLNSHVQLGGWVFVACAASLASWLFTRRIAGRSGLL